MKAKFSLESRSGSGFFLVPIRKGKFVQPPGAPTYYVRFTTKEGKRTRRALGTNFEYACAEVANMEIAREYIRRGIAPPEEIAKLEDSLTTRIADYLEEIKNGRSHRSWLAYRLALDYFKESCKHTSLQSITRQDLLDFKDKFLPAQGLGHRSIYNNFLNVMIFLKDQKVNLGIDKGDWPPLIEREVDVYDDVELEALFSEATDEERIVLKTFLYSGLRSGELAHLTYGNIDFRSFVFKIHPQNGWYTKNKKPRTIPVPDYHVKQLEKRMEVRGAELTDLVFPTDKGKVDGHLIRIVQRVAKRAKVTGRVDDHKFRATCATMWLQEGHTIEEVRIRLGHSNYDTIQRYVQAMNARSKETQQKISRTFQKFAAVGD